VHLGGGGRVLRGGVPVPCLMGGPRDVRRLAAAVSRLPGNLDPDTASRTTPPDPRHRRRRRQHPTPPTPPVVGITMSTEDNSTVG
jgi:hypothetical protein